MKQYIWWTAFRASKTGMTLEIVNKMHTMVLEDQQKLQKFISYEQVVHILHYYDLSFKKLSTKWNLRVAFECNAQSSQKRVVIFIPSTKFHFIRLFNSFLMAFRAMFPVSSFVPHYTYLIYSYIMHSKGFFVLRSIFQQTYSNSRWKFQMLPRSVVL